MNKASLALYRAKWQRFNAQVQARWQPLALREKRMVGGMALALIGLLLWVALIQPPLKKIAYWQTETPKLRAQTEALEVLLREVSVRPDGQSVAQSLEQTLQASGLAGHYQLQEAQGRLAIDLRRGAGRRRARLAVEHPGTTFSASGRGPFATRRQPLDRSHRRHFVRHRSHGSGAGR
jgi:type II secretory pathway component PulM